MHDACARFALFYAKRSVLFVTQPSSYRTDDNIQQFVGVERLAKKSIRTRCKTLSSGFRFVVRRDDDCGKLCFQKGVVQLHLQTGHFRHLQIENETVVMRVRQCSQEFRSGSERPRVIP